MADIIGAVRVVLGADTAAFEKGLGGASKRMEQFKKDMALAGVAIGAAVTSAAIGLGVAIKRSIDEADKLGKMAQAFGVPVEELSKLKHAADLSDVSLEQLGTALGRLSRNMSDAADGTGPAADAFRTLGINVRDEVTGGFKSASEIMEEVADKFVGMQDGAGKTALAIQIFGKAGAALIPMLNEGGDALRAMGEEAEKLGLVISERTAKSAEAFNDNLTRLGRVWDGVINRLMAESVGSLEAISGEFVNLAKDIDFVTQTGQMLERWMFNIARLAIQVGGAIEIATANFRGLANVARAIATGDFTGAIAAWNKNAAEMVGINDRVNASIDRMTAAFQTVPIGQTMFGDFAGQADKADKSLAPVIEKTGRLKRDYSELTDQIRKSADLGDKIRESLATPFAEVELQMAKVQFAFDTGAISAETFAAKMNALGLEMAATWGRAGASLAGSLQTAFTAIAGENKQMLQIAKVAGAAEALINTFVAQSKALAQGGIFGFAAAAAILAQGLALVASIKAVDIGGFAQGGSFMVPGAGGIDSKKFMMSLTPGERVDVHKPSDAGNRDMVVRGIRPRDLFTGEMVREMVLQLDDWVKHGGTGIRHAR
jgi:hypothetical protein